ncbi:AmmeMemoRadiSam system radical SAM enzyme [Clostridium sp.]|uniref:AmmeMemoRadiSam system radical SAM enzyme n=1 Tax=Clostridium sp. TaxID=1506 RepID=UPI003F2BC5F0
MMIKEALFYNVEDGKVKCNLCPHNCLIKEGHIGLCNVRKAMKDEEGILRLYTLNYGEVTSVSIDPIEKKPLYNFYPNSEILSIGSFGCNFKCSFCQNYSISQCKSESKFISPEQIIEISMTNKDNMGLAFTYNEPTIWYEYVLDVAKKIKELNPNHKVVLVTNGYINEEPLRNLLVFVDALNIDLKGGDDYYKKLCFGTLKEVERSIKIAYEMGCHIEVTTLLVPGENTDEKTLRNIGDFLASIDNKIPLHLSRYFPRYKMDNPLTPLEEIKKSYNILGEYLENIYLGNLHKEEYEFCIE